MATSPERVLAVGGTARTLSEVALDGLREAVLLVDTRHARRPVLLANAAARRLFLKKASATSRPDSQLFDWLVADDAGTVEKALTSLSKRHPAVNRVVAWRTAAGTLQAMTEIKIVDGGPGQLVVMLRFDPEPPGPPLAAAIDRLPMEVLVLDRNLKISYANEAAVRYAGIALERLLGSSALNVGPTAALSIDVYRRALAGTAYRGDPIEIVAAGAISRWFRIALTPLDDRGAVNGILAVAEDVTESLQRERAQANSDARLRALTANAQDVITVAGIEGQILYVSGGVSNALGYSPDERRWQSIFDKVHPDDRPMACETYWRMVTGETSGATQEYRIQHKDGSYRWFESTLVPVLDNPLIRGIVINSRDITARKQAELSLRQREEIFRLAADAVDGVIFEWDIPNNRVQRSHGVLEILGVHPETLGDGVDPWRERIHPPDLEASMKRMNIALRNGRGWTATYRIRDVRGRYRWILERALIQRSPNGDPLRAIGCSVDVTEMHRLSELLAETQRAAQTGGWEYFYETRELTWTDEVYRIHGTTPMEFSVTLDAALERLTADSRRRLDQALRHAAAGDGHFDLELRIHTFTGELTWVRMVGHFDRHEGRPFRVFGSLQSIESQKAAQLALESRSDWLELSMRMSLMRAWRWDRQTDRIEFAALQRPSRPAPRRLMRLKKLMARLHPDDRAAARRALTMAFGGAVEIHEEFRLRARDGSYRSYASTARPLYDAAGAACGLVGVTRDITERKRLEREILEVSGRERQRIGRDLHDGLGQELTGIALMLRGLARRAERDCPQVVESANEIVALVNQSIETARALARGLLPVSSEQGGLVAALGALAERSRGLYGLDVQFRAEVWPELRLEEADASHLYRIAQEALTNAARHGQATAVEIVLLVTEERFKLMIVDDGRGMGNRETASTGLGMKIMAYRANIIGATIEVAANTPRGTIVSVIGEQPRKVGGDMNVKLDSRRKHDGRQ